MPFFNVVALGTSEQQQRYNNQIIAIDRRKDGFYYVFFFSSVLYQSFVIFDMKHGDSMNVARMSANEMEQMFDHLIGTTCRRLASAIGRIILKRLHCVWHSIRLKMIQVVRLLADHFDARCTKNIELRIIKRIKSSEEEYNATGEHIYRFVCQSNVQLVRQCISHSIWMDWELW